MEYLVISIVALVAASLALFSGFGLGTLLTPAFILFFPVQVAVAAAAVVHLVNNFVRLLLVGRHTDWRVVFKFGLPAVVAAIPGAWLLGVLTGIPSIAVYQIGGRNYEITPVKMAIGIIIIAFAMLDIVPRMRKLTFNPRYLPAGGLLSGFFGGFSGQQGALRSAFLVKTALTPEAFIGTSSIIIVGVDVVRLAVYGAGFYAGGFASVTGDVWKVVVAAILSAAAGSVAGSLMVKRMTIETVRYIIGAMLLLVGAGLTGGLL
ncbi:MAG: hypothetical protein A2137_07615 [Chloroflexi bacterium RBG_16_58_8]|nr:MAG: hypothetical protein A2137_07615 [Chloroflexi bacterium RBG_16_58_8]